VSPGFSPTKEKQYRAHDQAPREKEEHAGKPADFESKAGRPVLASGNDGGHGRELSRKPDVLPALWAPHVAATIFAQVGKSVSAEPATAGESGRTQGAC